MSAVASTSALDDPEALLNARLLTDERLLRSAALKLLPILDLIKADEQKPASADDLALNIAKWTSALEALSLSLHKGKARAIQDASASDAKAYEQGIARIEADRAEAEQAILRLRAQLAEAQTRRRNKIEYDAIAKDIGKVPTRGDSQGNIERLANEIGTLMQEQSTYTETWSARKSAYDNIVASLQALTKLIKDEKAEADRRNAFDEDADREVGEDASRPLDPNAAEFKPSKPVGEEGEEMEVDSGPPPAAPPIDAPMQEEKEEGETVD